jgi:hypothetical protein
MYFMKSMRIHVLIRKFRAAFEADTTRSPEKLFGWIRSADPQGSRTIGIMTKFDQLTPYPYGKYRKVEQHLSLPVRSAMSGGLLYINFMKNI